MNSQQLVAEYVEKKNRFVDELLIETFERIEGRSPRNNELQKFSKVEVHDYEHGRFNESYYWRNVFLFTVKYGFDVSNKFYIYKDIKQ